MLTHESKKKELIETLEEHMSLAQLQNYMRRMTKERGFLQESPRDTLLLMVEEVGELARALRKHIGIGVDCAKVSSYGELEHELADVLIVLLVLANSCHVELFDALYEKERINSTRTWRVAGSCAKVGGQAEER